MTWLLYLNIESEGKLMQLVKEEFKEKNRDLCLKPTVYQGITVC